MNMGYLYRYQLGYLFLCTRFLVRRIFKNLKIILKINVFLGYANVMKHIRKKLHYDQCILRLRMANDYLDDKC